MSSIQYIYPRGQRPLVLDPNDPSEKEVLPSRAQPVGCIAYSINEVKGCPDVLAVSWGYSVWNKKRTFKKIPARALAKDRLENDYLTTFCQKNDRPSKMIADVLRDISRCSIHHWAGVESITDNGETTFINHPLSSKFRQACRLTEKRLRRRLKTTTVTEEKAA